MNGLPQLAAAHLCGLTQSRGTEGSHWGEDEDEDEDGGLDL